MREAKSLGIPLRQPGTGRHRRRGSVSSQLNVDSPNGTGDVWSCSHCQRTVQVKDPPLTCTVR